MLTSNFNRYINQCWNTGSLTWAIPAPIRPPPIIVTLLIAFCARDVEKARAANLVANAMLNCWKEWQDQKLKVLLWLSELVVDVRTTWTWRPHSRSQIEKAEEFTFSQSDIISTFFFINFKSRNMILYIHLCKYYICEWIFF